ncbi:hypothetical protein [Actinokineospora inagensis]|uniref:hypothetical protein n=1 Tax=Actinokineospora inagensis TaxID=103730 RepID=UPI00040F610A|nr:hypothetical protein [Actinokineospora inagensis]
MTINPGIVAEPDLTVVVPPRSIFRRKRFRWTFGPSAAVALVGVLLLFANGLVGLPFRDVVVVSGRLASKADYFQDPQVQRILMAHGLQVSIDQAGSRDIANNDVSDYDFVFPSGQPAALLIRRRWEEQHHHPAKVFKPFFSPIVLGTYREYADALAAEGVASPQAGAGPHRLYYDMPMERFVGLIQANKTWSQLTRGPHLDNGNRVLAQSSDTCSSNSAGTYLGLVAFVVNHNVIPQTEADAVRLANEIKPLLTAQGLPGDDMARSYFAADGKSLAPVAVIYEHQYLAYQLRKMAETGRPDESRVLLYPAAQFQTVPEFIALTPNGERLGQLIATDPDLRQRALELGFRVFEDDTTLNTGQVSSFLTGRGMPVPSSGVGDTETFLPALPLLEKMITTVGDCPTVHP